MICAESQSTCYSERMKDVSLKELTAQLKTVLKHYKSEFPDVDIDRDYFPFKVTEEWGECLQKYLMLTDRGRQKGLSKEEIHKEFTKEFADVLGLLLLFADNEGVDIEKAFDEKWFANLKNEI